MGYPSNSPNVGKSKARKKAAGWDNRYLLHLLGINLDA